MIDRKFSRGRAFAVVTAALGLLAVTGCRQDMHNQPKEYPQRGTSFYADGRSTRPQVENTVARGQLHEDTYFYTGMVPDTNGSPKEGDGLPFPATIEVLERGQERYNVYCTPCHSRVGNGVGMIVQRGYAPAGNLHTARLENAPLGHFFNVITNGYGSMPEYSAQVAPEDRWAITAYIRALQLSQNAKEADLGSGAHLEPLQSIAESQGLPATFADEWALPATAVYGTPNQRLPDPTYGLNGTTNNQQTGATRVAAPATAAGKVATPPQNTPPQANR